MLDQLPVLARGLGREATCSKLLPEIMDLAGDEEPVVQYSALAALSSIAPLLTPGLPHHPCGERLWAHETGLVQLAALSMLGARMLHELCHCANACHPAGFGSGALVLQNSGEAKCIPM